MLFNVSIILTSILMSSVAHVLLKKGTTSTSTLVGENGTILAHMLGSATNPWIICGIGLHVSALFVWLWALNRVDISFAYPFLAVGYVIVSLLAWQWLGETISSTRMAGMAIIITGIVVLSHGG